MRENPTITYYPLFPLFEERIQGDPTTPFEAFNQMYCSDAFERGLTHKRMEALYWSLFSHGYLTGHPKAPVLARSWSDTFKVITNPHAPSAARWILRAWLGIELLFAKQERLASMVWELAVKPRVRLPLANPPKEPYWLETPELKPLFLEIEEAQKHSPGGADRPSAR